MTIKRRVGEPRESPAARSARTKIARHSTRPHYPTQRRLFASYSRRSQRGRAKIAFRLRNCFANFQAGRGAKCPRLSSAQLPRRRPISGRLRATGILMIHGVRRGFSSAAREQLNRRASGRHSRFPYRRGFAKRETAATTLPESPLEPRSHGISANFRGNCRTQSEFDSSDRAPRTRANRPGFFRAIARAAPLFAGAVARSPSSFFHAF